MFQKIGLFLLVTLLATGCQSISTKELKALNEQADKAEQLQLENAQLKQNQDSLIQAVSQLNEQLEQEIGNKQVSVVQNGKTGEIKVTLQQAILFPSNSYEIDQEGAADILRKVVSSLNHTGNKVKLNIVGHTDNLPIAKKWRSKFSDNWDLSARRAGEVARFLIWGAGFPRENITITGRAEVEPVDTNKTEKGRAKNRRIEIFIVNQ